MQWFTELLKHLKLSRSIVGAIFLAATAQVVGSRLWPMYIEPTPKGWASAVFMALVLTGSLLLFWLFHWTAKAIVRTYKNAANLISAKNLSHSEIHVLLAMACDPNKPIDVDATNYRNFMASKIELVQLLEALKDKGLIGRNPYASNLYSLTNIGRGRALELSVESRPAT
jgi:hypothetical protein